MAPFSFDTKAHARLAFTFCVPHYRHHRHHQIPCFSAGPQQHLSLASNDILNAFLDQSPMSSSTSSTPASQFSSTIATLPTLPTLPTSLTSVKIFDGSEIVNPVVVSNSFWSNLLSRLPSLLLGQLLASLTFVIIASFVTAQGKFVVDRVASNLASNLSNELPSTSTSTSRRDEFQRAKGDEHHSPPSLDVSKLLLCIIIDILGSANEAIPIVGEIVDVLYAPMAALLLRQLFAGSNVVFVLEFAEEILPFTDVLPLATICWVVESFFSEGNLARVLRIGRYAPDRLNKIE